MNARGGESMGRGGRHGSAGREDSPAGAGWRLALFRPEPSFETTRGGGAAGRSIGWRIDGRRARARVWTDEEIARLDAPPEDARRLDCGEFGFWIALRFEDE